MLDEEQRGCHGQRRGLSAADDGGVEQGLQVVVAMVGRAVGTEDGVDVGRRGLQPSAACLVVDDADALAAVGADAVEAVDAPADGGGEVWGLQGLDHFFF